MLLRRALLPLALLLGCDGSPRAEKPAAPAAPAVEAHGDPVPPPPPPPAPERAVKEAFEIPPGDPATPAPLAPEGETVVDPGARFRVALAGACRDARLLLFDGTGAAVPSTETAEVGPSTVRTLTPAAALTPGSRYQLRLDGAAGRELHLADRAYPPARYTLRAAGDPPPPAPKATPKKKRSRRR